MATRTKSFFDQDHAKKPKPGQWNRRVYNDSSHRSPLTEAPPNIPQKPPIPATSEAKSKLQAFQFVAGGASEGTAEQYRGGGGSDMIGDGNMSSAASAPASGRDSQHTSTGTVNTPSLHHAHTFPCTPGARLPLEDLIGNVDETKEEEPVKTSPEEQLGWSQEGPSNQLTPNRRRKRKRAKSSSPSGPVSSSQPNEDVAMAGTQLGMKTPAADPAADLWQRYAKNKQVGDGLRAPDMGNLIFQGSPRPLETPVKDGKLRRWASTGNDWPSSKNKRRCTNTSRTNINVWQDQSAVESGGKSKVATMVQQLQASLASQRINEAQNETPDAVKLKPMMDAPSSSSPLPAVDSIVKLQNASPLQSRGPSVPAQASRPPIRAHEPIQPKPKPQMQRTQSGGIRFDPNRQVGDPLAPGNAPTYSLQSKAPLPAYKRPSITRPLSQPKVQQVAAPVAPPVKKTSLDEFGDDEFDLTADDFDELCSQMPLKQRSLHDIPPHPNPPTQPQPSVIHAPSRPEPQPAIIHIDDDDEFGDDDIDEESFAQAEFSATQTFRKSARTRSPRKSPRRSQRAQTSTSTQQSSEASQLQRYVVKQVVDGEYTNENGRVCAEVLLLVEHERTRKAAAITLRDSWTSTPVSPKAVIHVAHVRRRELPTTGMYASPPGQIIVSDGHFSPLLILHPDHMLSATTVADSFDCIRKAVLQDRIKATGETSKAMVYGKILHEIFQQALSANHWDSGFLDELVERTVSAHVEGLWELGMRDNILAVEEVKAKMGELSLWARIFVQSEPNAASMVDDKNGEKVLMSISKLIAIEEHIWSPRYGLKGNVDATVQTTVVSRPGAPDLRNLVVPFEVKTGKSTQSPAHRAQTALYTLLLSDRYDVAVEAGILYYLESSSMSRIAPPLNEIKQMVQQRNRLAAYIFYARNPAQPEPDEHHDQSVPVASQGIEESGLPAMLKNPFKCGRCYAQESCFSFHALVENGNAESAGMVDDKKKNHSLTWKEAIGHLRLEHEANANQSIVLKRWFAKWDKLLTFEEGNQSRLRKELWTMSSHEREAAGRCFGNLVLAQDLTNTSAATQATVEGIEGSGGKINRYAYTLARAPGKTAVSFAEGSQLTVGEPIVVSSESGQWALANGYVIGVSRHDITVAVDRKLGDSRQRLANFDDRKNQSFKGTMTVGGDSAIVVDDPSNTQMLYRLDKDEFANGLALVRNNLVKLMKSHPICNKLRDQIAFDKAPTFTPTPSDKENSIQPTQLGAMNEDQRTAVQKVLSANDYALILGMPGTGKTTTIAHIIRALLAEDKSILLTSFTHTAVDNILLKIRHVAPQGSILRLGVPAKINTQVQEFCQLAATPRTTIDEVDEAFMGTRIVATTCMGTNHALFNRRSFDVCIVDEASQITLPTILGPLLHARKFVLVGDHYQLPPLVQNKAALEGGLDVSLFRQLSEAQPDSVAELGRQYRMCEEIMSLSNELIYHGKLRCGNEDVAHRTLQVADSRTLDIFHGLGSRCPGSTSAADAACWLSRTTDPQHKVVFANTDRLGQNALETLSGGGKITNQLEATLAAQIVLSLLALGVPGSEIGVITLYRSQLALMRQLFRRAGISDAVEIDSADRFQGRDKECIVLSMVRSNEVGIVGDLLKDWRRVNVALTRARSKLVVLGSRRTLKNNELLEKMLEMMYEQKWSFDLPEQADEGHAFDFSTQIAEEIVAKQSPSPKKKKKIVKGGRSPFKASASKGTSTMSSQRSPSKRPHPLQSSASAGNRSPVKSMRVGKEGKKSPKVIKGDKENKSGKRSLWAEKLKQAREQVVMEIFEDLTGDEF